MLIARTKNAASKRPPQAGRARGRVGLQSVIDEGEQHEERQQIAEALGVANPKGGDLSDTVSDRPKAYTDQAATVVKTGTKRKRFPIGQTAISDSPERDLPSRVPKGRPSRDRAVRVSTGPVEAFQKRTFLVVPPKVRS